MLSGRKLVEDALQKRTVPRIPCFPLIDLAFAAAYIKKPLREVQLDPRLHAQALCTCADLLPVDGVYINLGLNSGQSTRIKDNTYLIDQALTLVIPENDVLSISSTDIKSLDDERLLTAKLFHPGMLAAFSLMQDSIKDRVAVFVGVTGTFSQVSLLYGIPELMMALLDQPEAVHRALGRRHEIVLQQIREVAQAGARFIWIGEGLGSGSLISPRQYRDFVLPYEQSMADEIRRQGALSLLHICGNVTAALPDIKSCKADGFDLDYPVDLQRALDILLPHVAVKGNINPTLFLPGQEETLRQACIEAKSIAGNRDGFIMSTGCLVPRDASAGSFQIMAEIVQQ